MSKYITDAHKERFVKFVEQNSGVELTAVFDIGTKAGRIIVAPKTPPHKSEWEPDTFFNHGEAFFLGKSVDAFFRTIDINEDETFQEVIAFMKSYKTLLVDAGVAPEEIFAVGTAVFRWLANRGEVVGKIEEETGVKLIILEEEKESLVSMYSIIYTYNFSMNESLVGKKLEKDDVILLIDQGGGSTEVSYFFPGDVSKFGVASLDECGTVALQKLFYTVNSDDLERRTAPELNYTTISRQVDRMEHFVTRTIDRWEGYPELAQKNIIAYAMGSAFSGSLPRPPWTESNPERRRNNFTQHNMGLSKVRIQEIIDSFTEDLDESIEEVCDLYKLLEHNKNTITRRLERKLTVSYGLPVYLQLMEKFNLRDISFAGFGLRYGVYIYRNVFKGDLNELSIATVDVDEEEREAIAWEQIRKYNTAAAYEAYLERYPEGAYAFIAGINLDKLKK